MNIQDDAATQWTQEWDHGAADSPWQTFCKVWDWVSYLQIIAGVKNGEDEALNIAEGHWISRLATIETQGGINSLDERTKI